MVRTSPWIQQTLLAPGTWLPRIPLITAITVLALAVALLPLQHSALLLTGTALGLAVIACPWIGLPVLAVSIPFAAVRPVAVGSFSLDGADLLLMLVLAAWLAQSIARGSLKGPALPLTLPLVLLCGALALSLTRAASYQDGLPELLKWVEVLLLYWCVATALPARRVPWLLAGLLVAGTGQAVLGLFQFLTRPGPEAFVLGGSFMRAYGTFGQPNPFAGYLGLVAPLGLSLSVAYRPRLGSALRRPVFWWWLATTGATGLMMLGLVASWSRGGWVAFALASVTVMGGHAAHYAWRRPKRRSSRASQVAVVGAALLALALLTVWLASPLQLLPVVASERLGDLATYLGLVDVTRVEVTDGNFSVIERLAHWQAATGMWADHPWLGVGAGNYAVAYAGYALPRWQEPLGHAHNVYLNFGAETGSLGLLAYLVFWVAAAWQGLRAASDRLDPIRAAAGIGVLGALVHATTHNLFDNLWVQHMYLHLALLLGLLGVLGRPVGLGASTDDATTG